MQMQTKQHIAAAILNLTIRSIAPRRVGGIPQRRQHSLLHHILNVDSGALCLDDD